MAIFRVRRKIFSTSPSSPSTVQNSSKKPGVVPTNGLKNNSASQQTNLLKNKQLNNQVKIAVMRNDRQDKINQRKLAEIEAKKQDKSNEVNIKSQELSQKEKRDISKVQTDLKENRHDLGKVMPAQLVNKLTTVPGTKSVNK